MAAPIAPTASRYSTVAAAQAVGPAWSARPGGFLIDLNGSFSSKGDQRGTPKIYPNRLLSCVPQSQIHLRCVH